MTASVSVDETVTLRLCVEAGFPPGVFNLVTGGDTKAGGREYLQHFLVPCVITENCLRRGFAPVEE